MGVETGIAWCDHTFNPWWGCVKVSPACKNCYAETFDHRLGGEHWGVDSTRKFFGDKHWREPLKWNAAAAKAGVRARVFCASMADVFEDRDDLVAPRARLWELINQTPHLDWLLLTKRPENIKRMLPVSHGGMFGTMPFFSNVWLGTTVEDQEWAEKRLDHLLENPAVVHFVSAEPLLGSLDLTPWFREIGGIDWVITGSESGHGRRPQDLDQTRNLRDDCFAYGVSFFLKQAFVESTSDLVTLGSGSWAKREGLVEQPYLDGKQHVEFPRPSTFRRVAT